MNEPRFLTTRNLGGILLPRLSKTLSRVANLDRSDPKGTSSIPLVWTSSALSHNVFHERPRRQFANALLLRSAQLLMLLLPVITEVASETKVPSIPLIKAHTHMGIPPGSTQMSVTSYFRLSYAFL